VAPQSVDFIAVFPAIRDRLVWVASAEDPIGAAFDIQLCFEGCPDINIRKHAKTLFLERCDHFLNRSHKWHL
jgi:hypothetical protein